MEKLRVSNLTIRRGKVRILEGVDWAVRDHQHWVILGGNGSGKTSLLSALTGYLTPTQGEMHLLGDEFGNSDWRSLRASVGLVSSSIRQMMPDHEPAWITVASGRFAMIDFWGVPSRKDRLRAMRILRQVECENAADRPWLYLSQGERQRILIGRALMARPKLLILDEPCAGLDPVARERFLDFLQDLGRRRSGPNLILVTHHVEEIMPVFSHVLMLRDGRVEASGELASTLTSSNLSRTFGAKCRLSCVRRRFSLKL
ncbi:MAG: ATP-binding cassette domain-containing protein [Verrucomicrobia bacterium]|nr:ATP-binding cassette domain-containing protein [Verrucomicrobiota bacterium]